MQPVDKVLRLGGLFEECPADRACVCVALKSWRFGTCPMSQLALQHTSGYVCCLCGSLFAKYCVDWAMKDLSFAMSLPYIMFERNIFSISIRPVARIVGGAMVRKAAGSSLASSLADEFGKWKHLNEERV